MGGPLVLDEKLLADLLFAYRSSEIAGSHHLVCVLCAVSCSNDSQISSLCSTVPIGAVCARGRGGGQADINHRARAIVSSGKS